MLVAISGRHTKEVTSEEYFLSSRSLRWPSIAFSTIATNIQGYQFLGMMGSAYLYGLAQASLEINAVQGILLASFILSGYPHIDECNRFAELVLPRLKTFSMPHLQGKTTKEAPLTPLANGIRI